MPQYWVKHIEPISRPGSLRALFDVEVESFGLIEKCRYMETERGAFVSGPAYQHRFSQGGWAHPVTFEEEVAGEILAVVQQYLAQEMAA